MFSLRFEQEEPDVQPLSFIIQLNFFPVFLNVKTPCYLSECYEKKGKLFKWLMTCNFNHATTQNEWFLSSDCVDKSAKRKQAYKQANKQTISLPVQTSCSQMQNAFILGHGKE
jgi:hypothetical protein